MFCADFCNGQQMSHLLAQAEKLKAEHALFFHNAKTDMLHPNNRGLATRPAVIEWTGAPLADPVWVDLLTGAVHAFPKDRMLRRAGGTTFVDVPVYDSPCLLTERSAIPLAGLK